MEEFSKTDYKALHILAIYVKENFINTHIQNVLTIDTIDIFNYKFFWDNSYVYSIIKKPFSNRILVPRYLSIGCNNTKLESLLYFGYEIFKLIDNQKQKNEHWFKYLINQILCKNNNNENTYELLKFFRTLQSINKELTLACGDCPDKNIDWNKVDKTCAQHQSHIFLVSSLFEMYRPINVVI